MTLKPFSVGWLLDCLLSGHFTGISGDRPHDVKLNIPLPLEGVTAITLKVRKRSYLMIELKDSESKAGNKNYRFVSLSDRQRCPFSELVSTSIQHLFVSHKTNTQKSYTSKLGKQINSFAQYLRALQSFNNAQGFAIAKQLVEQARNSGNTVTVDDVVRATYTAIQQGKLITNVGTGANQFGKTLQKP
ncbi:MAG: hypothetical protein IT342_01460 [Candidatus Melainabacteria bacterium]|nr:hypothetical protein [Candidatus Melainabacteria bacterium]